MHMINNLTVERQKNILAKLNIKPVSCVYQYGRREKCVRLVQYLTSCTRLSFPPLIDLSKTACGVCGVGHTRKVKIGFTFVDRIERGGMSIERKMWHRDHLKWQFLKLSAALNRGTCSADHFIVNCVKMSLSFLYCPSHSNGWSCNNNNNNPPLSLPPHANYYCEILSLFVRSLAFDVARAHKISTCCHHLLIFFYILCVNSSGCVCMLR
jgi:hypothetical protein